MSDEKALPTDTPTTYRESLRAAVIAKAGAILAEEGLEAVQARRVAREAGCAVGTLYNLFGDIDGLVLALNAATLAMLGEVVQREGAALAGLPLRDRLAGLALAYVRFALAHQRRWEAVFKHRLPPEREAPSSYLEDQARLIAVIEAAIAREVPEPDRRATTARALFGAVHGIVALALDNRLGGRMRDELELQVGIIVGLTARGLEAGRYPGTA
jgi:AcrR family transcriptional regulator